MVVWICKFVLLKLEENKNEMISVYSEYFLKLKDYLIRELGYFAKCWNHLSSLVQRASFYIPMSWCFCCCYCSLLSPSLILELQKKRSLLVSAWLDLCKLEDQHKAISTEELNSVNQTQVIDFGSELPWRLFLLATLVKPTQASNPLKQQSRNWD